MLEFCAIVSTAMLSVIAWELASIVTVLTDYVYEEEEES